MAKVATGANGQLYYTEMGSSTTLASMKTVNGKWLKFENLAGTIFVVYDITKNTSFITFTDISGSEGFGNSLNGQTSMAGIQAQLIATFNDSTGGGGGGNVTVVSSVLPTGAATEATLQAILAALGSSGTPHVLASSSVNSSGTVTAGKYSVLFDFSFDFTGTIDGVSYNGSDFNGKSFTAEDGRTLPAIPYTVTTGSLIISTLT